MLVSPFFVPMNYYLYILQSEKKETFYIGSSEEPERRLLYHNSESKGYTQNNRPWKLVYACRFDSKNDAYSAERKVKSWKSKKMIRLLIDGEIKIREYL